MSVCATTDIHGNACYTHIGMCVQ